jgi:ParB-like chromosome segregation protein Spo0J
MHVELNELVLRYAALRVRDANREARMRASLAADGQQSVVTVIAMPGDEARRFLLVDGYLRVTALRALGRDVVDAVCLELSEADALIMAHRLDEVGRRSALEEGWLLEELVSRHALKQDELGTEIWSRVVFGRLRNGRTLRVISYAAADTFISPSVNLTPSITLAMSA